MSGGPVSQIGNRIKRAALVAGLLLTLVLGYFTTSVVTSCTAEAQCICAPCIAIGGYPKAITSIVTTTIANMQSAQAQYLTELSTTATGVGSAVTSAIDTTERNMISWFDTFWSYNLRPAMQSMTRQLNTVDIWQSSMLAVYRDAELLNRHRLALYEKEIESFQQNAPTGTVCVAATLSGGIVRADTLKKAYNAAAATERVARSSNSINARPFSRATEVSANPFVRDAEAQVTRATALSRNADMRDRWQHYLENYCDTTYNNKNAGCKNDAPYKNRDLSPAMLIFSKPTIDVTDDKTKMMVDDLLVNLAEPFITDPIPESVLDKPEGQENMLNRRSYLAKRQAVYDALYYIVARRIPGSAGNGTSFASEVRTAAGVSPQMISANPSYNEVMKVMMTERFRSGNYSLDQIDGAASGGKEMVIQQAMQAMQMNDTLDLLDHYALVLAVEGGVNVTGSKDLSDQVSKSPVKNGGGP